MVDQNGVEQTDVDPSTIEEWRPKAEDWQREKQTLADLDTQRQELLKFQTELDNARELANGGKLSKRELTDLENQLKHDAPAAIAQRAAQQDNPAAPAPESATVSPDIQNMITAAARGAPQLKPLGGG